MRSIKKPDGACNNVEDLLRGVGLRPTQQRKALGTLLFGAADRHVTAETLHTEATQAGEKISLATVYNTLHQFCRVGLLRELAIEGTTAYFDTNTSNHSHFYIEESDILVDIPADEIKVIGLPAPPHGTQISHIDIVVRLAPKEPGKSKTETPDSHC